MGCIASQNADSHKGFNFLLPKWIDKNKVKAADSEALQRDLFLEYAPGKLWADGKPECEKLTNDQLSEACIPPLWLAENHYFTMPELAKMTMVQQKAELVKLSGIPDGPLHEFPAKLAPKGTFLNLDKLPKTMKNAAVAGWFLTSADAAAKSDEDAKKAIQEGLAALLKDTPEAIGKLDDNALMDTAYAAGFIRGAALVPDAELKQMEAANLQKVVLPVAGGIAGWGVGEIVGKKDAPAFDLVQAASRGKGGTAEKAGEGKSLTMEPFGKAYQPETEEDKKKKEEARKKKAEEKK